MPDDSVIEQRNPPISVSSCRRPRAAPLYGGHSLPAEPGFSIVFMGLNAIWMRMHMFVEVDGRVNLNPAILQSVDPVGDFG